MRYATQSIPEQSSSHQLVELSRAECLQLLTDTSFGRVVLSSPAGHEPMIRPVNYRFDEISKSVVFRSGDGSKFHALARSATALFEIDATDPQTRTAWSVIVSGVTHEITQPTEIRRLERLGLSAWAPGHRPHWIRIRARTVSGRRIALEASTPPGETNAR